MTSVSDSFVAEAAVHAQYSVVATATRPMTALVVSTAPAARGVMAEVVCVAGLLEAVEMPAANTKFIGDGQSSSTSAAPTASPHVDAPSLRVLAARVGFVTPDGDNAETATTVTLPAAEVPTTAAGGTPVSIAPSETADGGAAAPSETVCDRRRARGVFVRVPSGFQAKVCVRGDCGGDRLAD
mmetsp:Transcript_15531/g.48055  ORF Transcript_15531/g.48055 Transcript_15531/m.48055 type:complete len:183 (-) Transcript_15531:252-800(-)